MLEVIPTGGRLIWRDEVWSSSWNEALRNESKLVFQGARPQTLTANGQKNNKWKRVSGAPHREQSVFLLMFLRRRLSPVGKQCTKDYDKKCTNDHC
ncbi:unnamed protein product [Brassica rapa]|uniref:Uncharacterized protein n=2 Tax=Brassica TaxID=3705 RepID=A0A8D9GS06_BRACM|nr:unnamed protein product [Brassica napus]CAG7885396.1 unnamed protein product [Brassica rapa]